VTEEPSVAKLVYVGDRPVGDGRPCYVVAEAGVNHDGRLDVAMRLVEAAADAGADAVKFQKRTVRDILVREALSRPYETRPGPSGRPTGSIASASSSPTAPITS
jgi:sialic acid synthase SpsE